MSLRDLPKSLIDSVVEIATESQHKHEKQTSKLIEQGLKRFGVKAVDDLTENDQKALHAWVQMQLTESSCGCESDMTEDDMPGDSVYHKDGDEDAEKKKELDEDDKEDSLKESIALRADEIATNGAVGVTDPENQLPVHADVLKDTSVDGKHEFRLFVQFNTNSLPVIVPPVTLPGAPTVDALRDVVEGLPFFCDVCEKALTDAMDIPHERPEHAGVVSEAAVVSDVDRKRVALIRRFFGNSKVYITENNRVYTVAVYSDKHPGKEVELDVALDPSPKAVGKFVWKVSQNRPGYQGAEDLTPHPDVISAPFLPGDEQKSIQALQTLLNSVSRKIRAGEYEFDDSL